MSGSSSRVIARSREFRPRVRSVLLSLYLPYEVTDDRIARTLPTAADRVVHMIKLTDVDQVDDQLREWLTRGLRLQHRLRLTAVENGS